MKIKLTIFFLALLLLLTTPFNICSRDLHFGIISAIKDKAEELKEKIEEAQATQIKSYESTTNANGIATFTLNAIIFKGHHTQKHIVEKFLCWLVTASGLSS